MRTVKNSIFPTLLLFVTMAFIVSCDWIGGTKQTVATEIEAVKTESHATEVRESGELAKGIQAEEVMRDSTVPQEKTDWLAGDFKIELDEVPQGAMLTAFGAPTGNTAPARKVAIKSGNRLYYSTTEDGSLREIVFCKEGERIVSYLLAPPVRKALRTVSNWSSLEAILRSELSGSVWSEPKKTDKLTKTGKSERIAGVECEVWEMSIGLDDESAATAAAFAALGSMLGGGEKEEFKNPLEGMGGVATMWVDPTRSRFVARRHMNMKMNGRVTDRVTHSVTFFEAGNGRAHEIPDLSTYTIE